MTPPPDPQDSLLEKLSNRLVFVLAGLFGAMGIVGIVLANSLIHSETAADVTSSTSEALMVTGATTLIVSFALSDSIRLTPVIRRVFADYASQIPSTNELNDTVNDTVEKQLDAAIATLREAVQGVTHDLQHLASAFVLKRENIYSQSITMLQEMHSGEIRILMTAEEDLSTNPEANGVGSGEDWVVALNNWLSVDFDRRRLYRVIARRPQAPSDMEQVKTQLLEPFEGTNADQWVYTDPEFALSVMLLGTRRAVFGFLPRADRPTTSSRSRFQYAVVITNEMFVGNLVTWFDERYTKEVVATKVMTRGEIEEERLAELTDDMIAAPTDGGVEGA